MQTKGDRTAQEMARSDFEHWLQVSIERYREIQGPIGISEPVFELLKRAVVAISRHEPDCEELRGVARELEEVADALDSIV